MEDPILNRNLEETRELQTRWSQFHDFCLMAIQQGKKKINAQAEMKFLELKSRIAMLHDSFMAGLSHDQKVGMNIMQITNDSILLKRVADYSDAERQKFEFDWNECFLLLTETVGSMEDDQKKLAAINQRAYNAARRVEMFKTRVHNFIHSAGLRWAITAAVLVVVLFIIPNYVWSYRNIPQSLPFTKPLYKGFINYFWQPYIMKDYEYDDVSLLNEPSDFKPGGERIEVMHDTDSWDLASFEQSILSQLGLTPEDYAKAKAALETDPKRYIGKEHLKADGQDVDIFWFLLPRSQDVSDFLDVVVKGVLKLPSADQTRVKDMFYIVRRANFLAVGYSRHIQKTVYIKKRWKFEDTEPSELNK